MNPVALIEDVPKQIVPNVADEVKDRKTSGADANVFANPTPVDANAVALSATDPVFDKI